MSSLPKNDDKKQPLRRNKDYNAVIPNYILFDPDLSFIDIKLFSVINSFTLSNTECYATKAWFAKQIGSDEKSVQRAIKKLMDGGYILHFQEDGQWILQVVTPKIKSVKCSEKSRRGDKNVPGGGDKNVLAEGDKNVPHSIKNNIRDISDSDTSPTTSSVDHARSLLKLFKTHKIPCPNRPSAKLLELFKEATEILNSHDSNIEEYLNYLASVCKKWLYNSYEDKKNGGMRQNAVYTILNPSNLNKALAGNYKDQ